MKRAFYSTAYQVPVPTATHFRIEGIGTDRQVLNACEFYIVSGMGMRQSKNNNKQWFGRLLDYLL